MKWRFIFWSISHLHLSNEFDGLFVLNQNYFYCRNIQISLTISLFNIDSFTLKIICLQIEEKFVMKFKIPRKKSYRF